MDFSKAKPGHILEWIKEHYEGKNVQESRSHAGNWMNLAIDKIDKGSATISLTVKKDMTNAYGNIHGGMMSLVIDECIGWAVVSLDAPAHYVSLNLSVDFLYGVKEGEKLVATATIIRQGKKILNTDCHVHDINGRLLAKASSNLIATTMPIQDFQ